MTSIELISGTSFSLEQSKTNIDFLSWLSIIKDIVKLINAEIPICKLLDASEHGKGQISGKVILIHH